jgi:hypothetical protein
MTTDNFAPKMDLAFALRTIDAYPEDQPPTSQSDRFWFEMAARYLAQRYQRMAALVDEVEHQLDASEPQPRGGQQVGPRAEAWQMTPSTRKALRRLVADARTLPLAGRRPAPGTLAMIFGQEDGDGNTDGE